MAADALTEETTRHILIVDDDARVRHGLRMLIESSSGLSVSGEASSTAGAIRADDELSPDIVVLDLLLPSPHDGLQVLAHFVARGRAVVALTIRGELREPALDAGAVTFIEKGMHPDTLLDALRTAPLSPPATS